MDVISVEVDFFKFGQVVEVRNFSETVIWEVEFFQIGKILKPFDLLDSVVGWVINI